MAKSLYHPGEEISGVGYRKVVKGSWAPNGTSQPTQPTGETQYVTITRTGVGVFLFTFVDTYNRLIDATFSKQLNAAAAGDFTITGAVDTQTARTLSVTYMQESAGTYAAADVAQNANNRFFYEFTFCDTQATP